MVNRFFYPYLGGVEFHILNLSLSLMELGHKVSVACWGKKGQPARETFRGLELHRLRAYRDLSALMDEGFDIVHAHMPRTLLTLTGLSVHLQTKVPPAKLPEPFLTPLSTDGWI